jgi:hypothetical protein
MVKKKGLDWSWTVSILYVLTAEFLEMSYFDKFCDDVLTRGEVFTLVKFRYIIFCHLLGARGHQEYNLGAIWKFSKVRGFP